MYNTLKNSSVFFLGIIAFIAVYVNIVSAATSATVSATVTAQNVSVTVTDGTVAYGTVALTATKSTVNADLNDSQIGTNNGNITEDLNIRGQDTAAWTLAGSTAPDQYFHKFCNSNCDSSPTWTALTTSNQTLTASVTSSSSAPPFDLQIGIPSTSTSYTQQSVDIIVQASAS